MWVNIKMKKEHTKVIPKNACVENVQYMCFFTSEIKIHKKKYLKQCSFKTINVCILNVIIYRILIYYN